MTPKETREYEEGRAYGYQHPHKTAGWTKSVAWNQGFLAGKAEYQRDYKQAEAKRKAYLEYERRKYEAETGEKPKW